MELPRPEREVAVTTGGSLVRTAGCVSVAILGLAIVWLFALDATPASASHVSCGDEITADTTLDSDLVDCPNNGVLIGADDITLDLNGHLIDGDGTEFAACAKGASCDVGVVNNGHDGVTVTNGSVRDFAVGAVVFNAPDNSLVGISSSRNLFFGFNLTISPRIRVRDCSSNRNVAPDGVGLILVGGPHARIVNSTFRRNPGPAIHVFASTAKIKGNRFSHNAPGILVEGNRNQVRLNRSVRDDLGIMVSQGNRNVIARNRVSRPMRGIGIRQGRGNLVARNVIVRAQRDGIPLFSGANNTIRRNRVSGSGDDGFWVNQQNDRILLRRNVAVGTGDDGFDVDSASTKLTRNRAVRNGDLGINALRGVIDGGGNRAHGNGDPAQCRNVACK